MLWKLEQRKGKLTKVPYQANAPTKRASVTDAETWASLDDALIAHGLRSDEFDGIGFVLGDGLVGIDMDNCVNGTMKLHPAAGDIVTKCHSYSEISPGGCGVHIVALGECNGTVRTAIGPWGGKIEMYGDTRFFTFSGSRLHNSPSEVTNGRQHALDEVASEIEAYREDDKVLRQAIHHYGAKLIALIEDGDISGYDSQSEADQALCNYFARFTDSPERIFRLIQRSALMDEKWLRPDYRDRTIGKALEDKPTRTVPDFDWQWANELVTPAQPDWILRGYIAGGAITLIAGKPKSGKSTFVCELVEIIASGEGKFLGRKVKTGCVVYVSEEAAGTLKPKLSVEGIRVLTRDNCWPRPRWVDLLHAAVTEAQRIGAVAIVIDSLSFWGDLRDGQENDAGAMQRVLSALGEATQVGIAVVLVHHQRKGEVEDSGDAVRGSGAIFGAVDMLIEFERFPDKQADHTHRRIIAMGRWDQTLPVTVVKRYADGSWGVVGQALDRSDASNVSLRTRILQALGDSDENAISEDKLCGSLDMNPRRVGPELRELYKQGKVDRIGKGVRGAPYCYWRKGHAA